MKYEPWGSPSKYELMAAACFDKLVADLTLWSVVRTANQVTMPETLAKQASHATSVAGAHAAVVVRGARTPALSEELDVKGTTAKLWSCVIRVAIIVFDMGDATRATTLDAAEVQVINALHELQADTEFSALARDISVEASEPIAVSAEGDRPPYAGTMVDLVALVYE
ncbi:hypothetical protein LCGC14_2001890 [marine sediment metagenome]|uniref:Uncharacterized protein n=1 Tax=marine sediment metagenome TaxID=412755 RepID=A0A0F9FQM6_9ZZZZ